MDRQLIRITDAGDARIAAYRDIRERDLVGRQGRFVAEGRVVLNVLFGARRFTAESLLLLENRVGGLGDLLATVPADVPVYVASRSVLDAVAGFHMHRGVLAIGLRPPAPDIDALLASLPARCVVPVLVGISNHDNVGSIFRNAAAFDVAAVLLDGTCCDPLYRKSIRVSVGAALKVPFATLPDGVALFDALGRHGFEQVALSPAGAVDIAGLEPGARVALYLGSEGPGLPPSLMERMTTVRIPMSESFDSLNVAAASAIALHRLWPGEPA